MKKNNNFLLRGALLVVIAATLFFIFRPARDQVRLEHQTKQSLLVIQEALQKFHVEEEFYPKKSPMSGAELIQFLMETKHLQTPPLNPITLRPYTFDSSDSDRIIYTTDQQAETYSLTALEPNSDAPLFIVDSTEHHSLE